MKKKFSNLSEIFLFSSGLPIFTQYFSFAKLSPILKYLSTSGLFSMSITCMPGSNNCEYALDPKLTELSTENVSIVFTALAVSLF